MNTQWRIVTLNDEVITVAGRFAPWLRAEGVGNLNLYTGPVNGVTDASVAYSTPWRTVFQREAGRGSTLKADSIPNGWRTPAGCSE